MKLKHFIREYGVFVLFLLSALIVVAVSLLSISMMMSSAGFVEETTKARMVTVSKAASQLVFSDELEQVKTVDDMDTPLYADIRSRMQAFAEEYDLDFVYFMRLGADDLMHFIIDSDPDESAAMNPGSDPVERERVPDLALDGEAASFNFEEYSDGYPGTISAFAPVFDADGKVTAIAGVDMTDNHYVQAKNNIVVFAVTLIISILILLGSSFLCLLMYYKKAKLSESANVAKSSFLSRMSHEIRTPMNAIVGLCRMAKESDDIAVIRTHLDNITVSSNHLRKLIDDILDLSKIESGKVELEILPIQFYKELDGICSLVRPQMMAKKLDFLVDVPPDIPKYVYCDGTHLKQIVVNLLANAIKFTPENGRIALTVRLLSIDEGRCNLEWTVSDTGIGIRSENLPKIFDPFEQEDSSTTRVFGGTGLGLSISKQLVEMMDGHIAVTSKVGEGSVFTFDIWLKIAPEEAVGDEEPEAAELSVDLTGKTILLVEDSELNQLIAENIFTGMGAEVDIAENGHAGFKKYWENPDKYDIIFMDIQMPLMDGYETTREIRNCGVPGCTDIPIVAMTANVFREDVERALNTGMNGHVGKPFEIEQIKKAILDVLK